MATRKKATGSRDRKSSTPKRAASKPAAPVRKRAAAAPQELAARLTAAVPDALCELTFENGFQLLIATILSAQSTDKAVNSVTPALFTRYPDAAALAEAEQEDVEVLIKRTGFYRNKSKSIRGAAQKLVDDFGGEVPRTLAQLITLPGVARKTANVVLGTAYRLAAGFVVDTHVTRVSQRLGLSTAIDPVKIEQDLCQVFPEDTWIDMGHRVLLHGRYTCLAKAPKCAACAINELCPSRLAAPEGSFEARAEAEAARVREGMNAGLSLEHRAPTD